MKELWIKRLVWTVLFLLLWCAPVLAGTAQYTYDSLNRLVRVQYDNGAVIDYTYDAAGNRTVKQVIPSTQAPQAPASGQTSGPLNGTPVIQTSPPRAGGR